MQANETKLQSYIEGTKQYVVPLFQRPYSWEEKHWRNLWNDLKSLCESDNPRPHFMGSVVVMPTISVPEGATKYLLIDGQQRLTTLFILLCVIRDFAKESGQVKLAEEIENTLLVNPYKSGQDRFKLMPTQEDRSALQALILTQAKPVLESKIVRSYRFFDKMLRRGELSTDKLKSVIAGRLSIVSIVLDNSDNPYLVFEGLNAKGMPLSQSDLVRNYFLMRVHVDQQEMVYSELWKPIETDLGENLTEFLRHFLMRTGTEVKKNDVYFDLKDQVTTENVLDYLTELKRFAGFYLRLINPSAEPDEQIRRGLARMRILDISFCYPFLLNCYDQFDAGQLSKEDLVETLSIIENFIIRRFVCGTPTQGLNRLFAQLYKSLDSMDLIASMSRNLSKRDYPTDRDFCLRLPAIRLYGSGDRTIRAKLILGSLEESFDHKEPVSFHDLNIEHVMPQTLTEEWQRDLGENWQGTHDTMLHTIGNLTLTGYNPELSNAPFSRKRDILAQSHLELNKYFSTRQCWNESEIQKRGKCLADIALKVWPYFGEKQDQSYRDTDDVGEMNEQEVHSPPSQRRNKVLITAKRAELLAFMEQKLQMRLQNVEGWVTLYESSDKTVRCCFVVSKRYHDGGYWYAYHTQWDEFLTGGNQAFYIIGCLDKQIAIPVPHSILHRLLPQMDATQPKNRPKYWHVRLKELAPNNLHMRLTDASMPLQEFVLDMSTAISERMQEQSR